jgi:ABC-type phosphate transport system permease subunit
MGKDDRFFSDTLVGVPSIVLGYAGHVVGRVHELNHLIRCTAASTACLLEMSSPAGRA